VHTKKYLCAERWGGRRRELGSRSGLIVTLDITVVEEGKKEQFHVAAGDEL